MHSNHQIYLSDQTLAKLQDYKAGLLAGEKSAGAYLRAALSASSKPLGAMSDHEFLTLLLQTKKPQIFAESEVHGFGEDWNLPELSILGDVSFAVPVTIFDNGVHRGPLIAAHDTPFQGELLFMPSALLAGCQSDAYEVVNAQGQIDDEAFYKLYERRLMPLLAHANESATADGKQALITIPGLGCGAFAGTFKGQLEPLLQWAIGRLLDEHGEKWPHIKAINFDPNQPSALNNRETIHGITFETRAGNFGKDNSQLKKPEEYGAEYKDCKFFSVVAWDHVSWPGNDFYIGSRQTDDGVKAAATDVCAQLTGVKGAYDARAHQYNPPAPYRIWDDVVQANNLSLEVNDIRVVDSAGKIATLEGQGNWAARSAAGASTQRLR